MNLREATVAVVLLVFAIVLGVYPESMFGMMRESMALLVDSLDAGYQAAPGVLHSVQAAIGK